MISLLWKTTFKTILTLSFSVVVKHCGSIRLVYKPTALSRPGGGKVPVSVRAVVSLSSGLQSLLEGGRQARRGASEKVE